MALEQALRAAAPSPHSAAMLPQHVPTVEEAYTVQRNVYANNNVPVTAWKLGLTGAEVRKAFGAKEPTIGRLAASSIFNNRSEIQFFGPKMFAEAELIFEMGEDLPIQAEPYTRSDLCAALKGVYAGIEIVRSRFETTKLSLPLLIADNSMGHGLVLGRKLSLQWEDRFGDMPVSLTRNDEAPTAGSTARVMGNPLDAVVWLANWLRANEKETLKREQLIASGTCTGATEMFAGDTISIDVDGEQAALVKLCTDN